MADETLSEAFADKEHQAAYIFDPSEDTDEPARSIKRRRVSKKHGKEPPNAAQIASLPPLFPPLFNEAENEEHARLRQKLFEESWSHIDTRIHHVLREANQSTLKDVTAFVQDAPTHGVGGKIPTAFIITGANIASQDLLFEQLSEYLQQKSEAKVVIVRSGDASNLKATLKKIIHDIATRISEEDDDIEVSTGKDGRKYLNYDLEALHAYLKVNPRRHIIVAFQDSEAFESGLLSDLIQLFSSWLDRIPFTLLFGIATSVELFQARLLKSTCQLLYGDQFDVEQSASIVERIFKTAVAHTEAPLRLGPTLLQSLLERQRDQVSGIPVFVSSLRYAYMCHFYANPLSVLLSAELGNELVQNDHLEALRCLPSFRSSIEALLQSGAVDQVRLLIDNDEYLITHLREELKWSRKWVIDILRIIKIFMASKTPTSGFTQLYLDALTNGIDVSGHNSDFLDSVQRMQPSEAVPFLEQALEAIKDGDEIMGLAAWAEESKETVTALSDILKDIKTLQDVAGENGNTLRSKYSGQNRVLRTTVVAQKVQLSHDAAALTQEDRAFTVLMDRLVEHLKTILQSNKPEELYLHEVWLYDSKVPYKDVFVPRPRAVVERALSRPHDYLGCSCCKTKEDQITPTLPSTAIIYQLYLETGSLINVADLWAAYYATVGEESEKGLDDRTALVLFYRALSEMRAMGFVKQSRKKADHIAKLAWKGL
ncbi:origin recognition complex subunit 3 N-terminus-domain-containing protein [Pseudomassariella vexata]|uniref:Origin recognition complex subunit 3 N-terminus-domain-containing protein n=1 Tax=Pseudomassariella vexata TaxID=1141098 RepID=A0A1Y2DM12_9PEZI|nr:origin recognition complex subunit 3 N-terminus-domain-containing protein [Pseudomassariella vexata]ORY60176.1 origin recognition complex subunit 3 N-terminus-domain-containing protein [Pseudomassariella vexata]